MVDEDGTYSLGDFTLVGDTNQEIIVIPAVGFNDGGFGDNGFGGEDETIIISQGSVTLWEDDAEGLDSFSDVLELGTSWTDI